MTEQKQTSSEIPKEFLNLQQPAFEEVFESEDNFNGIIAYIKAREALQEEIAQLESRTQAGEEKERGIASVASKGGAAYRSNRLLDELLVVNRRLDDSQGRVAALDEASRRGLLDYGNKWMEKLLEVNRSAFQVASGTVLNPRLRIKLGATELEMDTYSQPFYFSNFDSKIRWGVNLKKAGNPVSRFEFDVKYDSVESGTAREIRLPTTTTVDFESQRTSLADLYSGIFLAIADFRKQEQKEA